MALKDEIKSGDKFNYFTVLELFSDITQRKSGSKQTIWYAKCKCDCGKEKNIRLQSLATGKTKSCGCYNQKLRKSRTGKNNPNAKNQDIKHPLYQSWKTMKRKCDNHNAKDYCGSTYPEEWKSYSNFYKWAICTWKEKTYLTRLNISEEFSPKNCVFRTKKEINSLSKFNPEKAKQTSLERYGVSSYTKTQEYKNKVKQSALDKYGVEHHSQAEEVKEKLKQTNLEKYGVECVLANQDIKDQIKQTNLEKYGVEYPSQSLEIRQKQIDTLLEKYGTIIVKTNGEQQKSLQQWVEKISNKSFQPNWKILNGKEINLYNNELKLGIEYCGLLWHSEIKGRDKNYHYFKYNKCREQNIQLIPLFADEFLYKNKQVKNFIKSILQIYEKRIFARKCEIKEINKKEAIEFIDQNHIQGKTNSIIYFGLFYNNELIGCCSLRKHHRNNKDLILNRLCFKDNIQIVGGASKLLKQCEKWAAKNNYDKIISWSDNRWSIGNVYQKMGFILDKELPPDYSYIEIKNAMKRKSKQSMKKKNIGCPNNITENEWTKQLGYSRIWDCGKKRWVKKIKTDI